MVEDNMYDVALSFAGQDREYVDEVAKILQEKGIKVFYDKFEEENLWGKNLYEYLTDIYSNKAHYTIMFISQHYNERLWTNLERRGMQSRAFKENREYILPVRFDDTEIPGLLDTIGYLSLSDKSPIDLCEIVIRKLNNNKLSIPPSDITTESANIGLEIGELLVYSRKTIRQAGKLVECNVTFSLSIENYSKRIVRDYKLDITFPKRVLKNLRGQEKLYYDTKVKSQNKEYVTYSVMNKAPLFPDDTDPIFSITIPVKNTDSDIFDVPIEAKLYTSTNNKAKRFDLDGKFEELGW